MTWQQTRLKYIADANTSVLPEDTPGDHKFTYVDIGNVTQGSMNIDSPPITFSDAPSRARRIAKPGDSVVSTVRTYLRAVATVPDFEEPLVFSTGFAVLHPKQVLFPRFLSWYLQGDEFVSRIEANSTGVSYPAITPGQLMALPLQLPPYGEQRDIAEYLDRETAQIDKLIEEQLRLIEMLHERRTTTISSALTRGLNPAAPVKHSGVSLLGEIPAHWRMVPTRYLCTITTGGEDSGNAIDGGEYPFFVRGREILTIGHYSFDCEAVMTPGDGQGGTGKVFHYFDGKFEAHQRVYVFKEFEGILGWYFYYFLSTFLRNVALAGSNTVTMESLRRPLLADFRVAVPPLDEQRRTIAYLDAQTSKIDTLIAETETFIKLSRERRSALITAAVTGQIDVRSAA